MPALIAALADEQVGPAHEVLAPVFRAYDGRQRAREEAREPAAGGR